jgi:ribose transport system substrate-binding protein
MNRSTVKTTFTAGRSAIAFVAILAVSTLLAACNRGDLTSTGNVKSVAFGHASSASSIYPVLVHGAQREASARGYKLLTSSANDDSAAQLDELNTWIAQRIAGVIVAPVDSSAMGPVIERAHTDDVKFLSYANRSLPGVDGSVVFDNPQGAKLVGRAAANWVNTTLGGRAKVALLTYDGQEAGRQRIDGAVAALTEMAPAVEIVARQEAVFADKALPVFQSMLQAHPDINVVLCMADDACLGAERAFMQSNPSKERQEAMFMAGWDGTMPVLEAIASGSVIRASGLLDLDETGRASIEATINAVEGSGRTRIDLPYVLIEQSDPAKAQTYIDKYQAILAEK